jgi:putative sigma-54 modulation protein
MTMSVQITFRDIDHSDAVDDRIREHAERLGKKFGERATSLHVTLSAPHHSANKGRLYQFTLEFVVPKGEIVVRQGDGHGADHSHEDVYIALRDAFKSLERRTRDHFDKLST